MHPDYGKLGRCVILNRLVALLVANIYDEDQINTHPRHRIQTR
jgi:hypothetical protein